MLARTLDTTKAVAVEVRRAAEDLAVVATVLEQELPEEVQVGDVALAIAHADELEQKLSASAAKLVEANEALAHEIEKRVEVTRQRDESEARVAELTKEVDDSRAS
ncbi:hypothetical protein ACSFA3_01335 [Variovorax sp. RHLX14]|uniref:hypothetical protein n=1 Tax=Variovorax sp. RHLX14 TaxID=1259731 RepID=UPI003F45BCF6